MTLVLANVLQPLINVGDHVLVFLHGLLGSWGVSIIALTVIVRVILLPLTLKQFRSMQALSHLQPQMKQLQEKYKDDKQRLNQEMMKFYQENKVNPFASCLPLALQMPVFIGLFYLLRQDLKIDICGPQIQERVAETGRKLADLTCEQIKPGSADFLFISDLTDNATGLVLVVLITAYVASQLFASLVMSVTADKNQRRLIILLPLLFVAFIIQFPAGLIVYWITTNLWTIAQGYIVRYRVGPMRPASAGAGSGDSPVAAGAKTTPAVSPPPPPRKRSRKRSGRRR